MDNDNLPSFESTEPVEQRSPQAVDNMALPAFDATEPVEAVAPEQMPKFEATEPAPPEVLPTDTSKYETPTQMAATFLEGAAQGATFGLSNYAETAMGISTAEDIAKREEANPGMHGTGEVAGFVGSLFVPFLGEGNILAKIGGKPAIKLASKLIPLAADSGKFAKIGHAALKGAVHGAVDAAGMQAGDELGKALIGKGNSADAVAMHIVGAGALGMCVGGTMGAGGAALRTMSDVKMDKYLNNVAMGIGAAKEGKALEVLSVARELNITVPEGVKHGMKLYEVAEKKAADKVMEVGLGVTGAVTGGMGGAGGSVYGYELLKKVLNPYSEKLISKVSKPLTKKVLAPIMIRAIEMGSAVGATDALEYAAKASVGESAVKTAIAQTLKKTVQKGYDFSVSPEQLDELDDYISNGGITQQIQEMNHQDEQNYAQGGKVKATPKPLTQNEAMGNLYPDQHLMLTAAKGKVSNYLTSLKPQKPVSQPVFDTPYHDKHAEKSYRNALGIAIKPLSVLHKIQKGTVDAEDIKHLNSMYPEVQSLLAKKVTEEITKDQLAGRKPDYKIAQGLSLLLGTALKSEMTSSGIQAAQATFIPKQAPEGMQQGAGAVRKNKAALTGIPKAAQTADQARAARANKDT